MHKCRDGQVFTKSCHQNITIELVVGQHGNTAHPYTEFYKRYQLTLIDYLVCMMRRGAGERRNDSRETDGGKGNRLG